MNSNYFSCFFFLIKNNHTIISILCYVQCTVLLLLIINKNLYSKRAYKKNVCRGVAKKMKLKKGVTPVKRLRNTGLDDSLQGVP